MKSEIFNKDCREVLTILNFENKEWCDLAITSPPYKDEDGYTEELVREVYRKIFEALKLNSLFFLNFGHLANFKERPFEQIIYCKEAGFKLAETFIWVKNHYKPIQGNKRVNNLTEFVFMFYKGDMPNLDRLSIGIPYKDKTNAKRFAGGRDLKCAGNVWNIKYETIQKEAQKLHNDRFPIELPQRCIKLSGIKSGSTICDPFLGSGTAALVAKRLGMNYIGCEINFEHYTTAKGRLKE